MTQKPAALLVAAMSGTIVVAAAIISTGGLRPYDYQEINAQIDNEDSALCTKFGFDNATEKFKGCLLDLADLRKSTLDLLGAYAWL